VQNCRSLFTGFYTHHTMIAVVCSQSQCCGICTGHLYRSVVERGPRGPQT